ncbi:SGNH hydrolase domain-containing protein [Aliiroseovarius sp.]|uniref:SGNH hydrolase domain-containing protein n=1 Tax=Aliiroseovarius sp. TaxID=1872442 RepID=UPI003BAB469C
MLFIGDSHSNSISFQAQSALKEVGISSYAYAHSGCIAFRGLTFTDPRRNSDCDGYIREMLAHAKAEGITTLVITSRFTLYVEGTGFDNGEGAPDHGEGSGVDRIELIRERAPDPAAAPAYGETRRERVLATFASELEDLTREFNVVLVYPIPEAGWDVPLFVAQNGRHLDAPREFGTLHSRFLDRNRAVEELFDGLDLQRLFRVRPADLFCNTILPDRCAFTRDGVPLYYDDNHLANGTGAKMLAPLIVEQVEKALSAPAL